MENRFELVELIDAKFTLLDIFETNKYTYGDIKTEFKNKLKFKKLESEKLEFEEEFKKLKEIVHRKCNGKIDVFGIKHYDTECTYNKNHQAGYYNKRSRRINKTKSKLLITKRNKMYSGL